MPKNIMGIPIKNIVGLLILGFIVYTIYPLFDNICEVTLSKSKVTGAKYIFNG
jgi:flagellar biosynthesis protein FliR